MFDVIARFYNLMGLLLLCTQILTNVLPIPTTVMLPWPLVKIRLGLSSATVFKGTQETGSCVQVTHIYLGCAVYETID